MDALIVCFQLAGWGFSDSRQQAARAMLLINGLDQKKWFMGWLSTVLLPPTAWAISSVRELATLP